MPSKTPKVSKYSGKGVGVLGGKRHTLKINSADDMNFKLEEFHRAKGKTGVAGIETVIHRNNK